MKTHVVRTLESARPMNVLFTDRRTREMFVCSGLIQGRTPVGNLFYENFGFKMPPCYVKIW